MGGAAEIAGQGNASVLAWRPRRTGVPPEGLLRAGVRLEGPAVRGEVRLQQDAGGQDYRKLRRTMEQSRHFVHGKDHPMTARTLASRTDEYDFSGLPPEVAGSTGLWSMIRDIFRLRIL